MMREESSTFSTILFSLFLFVFISEIQARRIQQVCSSSCGEIKNISYPFRLKGDPAGCGDRDFELSCESNKTILEIQSGKYYVKDISYGEHIISVVDVNLANGSCSFPNKSLPKELFYKTLSNNRTALEVTFRYAYANFLDCSGNVSDSAYVEVPCLSGNGSHVYVSIQSGLDNRIYYLPDYSSCRFISMVPILDDQHVKYTSYETIKKRLQFGFQLEWSIECRDCAANGGTCLVIGDGEPTCNKDDYLAFILTEVSATTGSLLLDAYLIARLILAPLVLLVFLLHKYRTRRKTVDSVEKFLDTEQSWMPRRYSYHELIAVTNNFRDKLGQGGFGSVYKGQLLYNGDLIAVKILENSKFSAEEFINEVSTIGRIHHVNVVQLVGFCSEGSKRALVYEYMPNGSLDKYLFTKDGKGQSFSWEKLHEIAVGIACGIQYLHEGCDVCILHFDIKPHNILLDHHFNPKISDFGLAKFYPKENDFVSISATRGTIGYIAPELISRNFGAVSCKSDVFSFGMLLLEMAGGRRNSAINASRSSRAYFPSWVHGKLIDGGDLELQNVTEIEAVIARKLCIIGLWCIQVNAADRPSMTKVMEMLEGSIDDLPLPPKPCFSSSQHVPTQEIQTDSSTELLENDSLQECPDYDNDSYI